MPLSATFVQLIEKLQRIIELLTLIILMQLESQAVDAAKLKAAGLRSDALQAKLAAATKNSRNSSKPPSSDIVKAPRPPRLGKRKIGGQKRASQTCTDGLHPRANRPLFPRSIGVLPLLSKPGSEPPGVPAARVRSNRSARQTFRSQPLHHL